MSRKQNKTHYTKHRYPASEYDKRADKTYDTRQDWVYLDPYSISPGVQQLIRLREKYYRQKERLAAWKKSQHMNSNSKG